MATTKYAKPKRYDAVIENHMAFFLIRPLTPLTRTWLEMHTAGQWFGGALFVEGRFVEQMAEGLVNAGFRI